MEKTFVRVRSIKDLIISASFIISGSVLIVLPTGTGVNIAGFFMILAGIIMAIILRTSYKDTETGEQYMKKEHYFNQAMNSPISAALKSRPETIDLSQSEQGNSIKLDIYYSRQSAKAYLQLFEYVPYRYEPSTKMYEYPLERVNILIKG